MNKIKGMEYLREGNVTAATSCFQRGVDITPQMAYNLIKVYFIGWINMVHY